MTPIALSTRLRAKLTRPYQRSFALNQIIKNITLRCVTTIPRKCTENYLVLLTMLATATHKPTAHITAADREHILLKIRDGPNRSAYVTRSSNVEIITRFWSSATKYWNVLIVSTRMCSRWDQQFEILNCFCAVRTARCGTAWCGKSADNTQNFPRRNQNDDSLRIKILKLESEQQHVSSAKCYCSNPHSLPWLRKKTEPSLGNMFFGWLVRLY